MPKKAQMYSVWVGGTEVHDYYVPLKEAQSIAEYWESQGHDDVEIGEQPEDKDEDSM